MPALSNERVALVFDAQGRLAELHDASGHIRIPIDANGLTDVCVVANTKGVLGLNWIEFQE